MEFLPVISKNLSHCDCQKSPDAPQNFCKCLAGKSNGTGIDINYFIIFAIFNAKETKKEERKTVCEFGAKLIVLRRVHLFAKGCHPVAVFSGVDTSVCGFKHPK